MNDNHIILSHWSLPKSRFFSFALLFRRSSSLQANAYEWPTISLKNFRTSREVQAKGKQIMLTGIVTVEDFGSNDLTYCGVSTILPGAHTRTFVCMYVCA